MVRYFENPYEDFNESKHTVDGKVQIDVEQVKHLVKLYVAKILKETKKENYKVREDLYVGDAGIAFTFLRLSKSPELSRMFPCLEHANFYINRAKAVVVKKGSKSEPAFLCGNAGIYAVSTVISKENGNVDEYNKDLKNFLKGLEVCSLTQYDADEILVGRAGYLSGMYWINQKINPAPISNADILSVCSTIVNRGRHYSRSRSHPLPLMFEYYESDYLGAAHGLCSILHMLLDCPWFHKTNGSFGNISETKFKDIKDSIDGFLAIQDVEGNFPTRYYDSDKNLVHWCHGASGAIYLLAKSYLTFGDQKYLEASRKCADLVWEKGLLYKGPGICHGVAGNGYALLLMYRLTNEEKFLYRATKFMDFLMDPDFLSKSRTPDRPYSLYEGLSGSVCFLADLLEPEKASFPFMDVFDIKFKY